MNISRIFNKLAIFIFSYFKKTGDCSYLNFGKVIKKINTIDLKLIVGVEKQKKILLKNTENFAIGNFTNNALLWGTRGNGKSTLIKSVFLKLSQKYTSLKLIQLNKNNIFDTIFYVDQIRNPNILCMFSWQ
mgnify:CR=1 FL=1